MLLSQTPHAFCSLSHIIFDFQNICHNLRPVSTDLCRKNVTHASVTIYKRPFLLFLCWFVWTHCKNVSSSYSYNYTLKESDLHPNVICTFKQPVKVRLLAGTWGMFLRMRGTMKFFSIRRNSGELARRLGYHNTSRGRRGEEAFFRHKLHVLRHSSPFTLRKNGP